MRADELSGSGDDLPPDRRGAARFELLLTPMRRRHLRSITRIQAADPHLGWSIGLWLSELRHEHNRVYVVAQIGRQVIGYAGLLLQDEDAHVTTIGVVPEWQHRGIGSRLMLVLVRQAIAAGAQNLTLEVRAGNAAAIAMYRRFGLSPAGVRKDYYADLGEDALIMWAHDIDGDDYSTRLSLLEVELERAGGGSTTIEGFDQ